MNQKSIEIYYFTILREIRGLEKESLPFAPHSAQSLYDELQRRYQFPFTTDRLKIAVNDQFCSWDRPLAPGDKISFIPPVAGG